jgi:hypothetical protein
MTLSKILYSTILLVSAASFTLKAQDTKPPEKATDDKKITEEIEVVRPYKPVLAEAVKLRRSPDLNNVGTYKAKFNYSITDKKLELNSDINKLQAQEVAEEKKSELVNNYVKGALGSMNTSLFEAYVNTGRDEALQAGAYFRHFGTEYWRKGNIKRQDQLSKKWIGILWNRQSSSRIKC